MLEEIISPGPLRKEGLTRVLTRLPAALTRPSSPAVLSSAAVGPGEEGEQPGQLTIRPGCTCIEAQVLL